MRSVEEKKMYTWLSWLPMKLLNYWVLGAAPASCHLPHVRTPGGDQSVVWHGHKGRT